MYACLNIYTGVFEARALLCGSRELETEVLRLRDVCVYVCVYVCIYVCIYVYIYIYVCVACRRRRAARGLRQLAPARDRSAPAARPRRGMYICMYVCI